MRNGVMPVVILAGGYGYRMEELGEVLPKWLMPVYDKILLQRLLDYLSWSGSNDVFISTRRELVNQVNRLCVPYKDILNIEVVENRGHEISLIRALDCLGGMFDISEPFVLCLSDIYFSKNPFDCLEIVERDGDLLMGVTTRDRVELSCGGIVGLKSNGEVSGVFKEPVDFLDYGLRWSGLAICGRGFWNDFREMLVGVDGGTVSLEEVFQYRLKKGISVEVMDGIDFVNINSVKHLLLANIEAALVNWDGDGESKRLMSLLVDKLKKVILESGSQI